jgi:hypothetical protein
MSVPSPRADRRGPGRGVASAPARRCAGRRGHALPALLALLLVGAGGAAGADRVGVTPLGPWACPESHPIKGYVSATVGHRMYFAPSHRFYDEASPERCYATESDARRDGGLPALDPRPLRLPSDELG